VHYAHVVPAVVESGIAFSHVIAAPLAAACLSLDGLRGMAGWQWLFLLEGLPTLVLAGVMAW
jgi:MFS transporter, ACS family, tartrate transporter